LKATVCGCGRWLYHCQPYQPPTERPPTTKSSTRAARGRVINHCNQGGGCQERRPRSREHTLAKPRRIKRTGASKDCLFMTSSWGGGASAPVQVAGRCAYRPWPEVRSMCVLLRDCGDQLVTPSCGKACLSTCIAAYSRLPALSWTGRLIMAVS